MDIMAGRHKGSLMCDNEHESVWKCPVCSTRRMTSMCKLEEILGGGFEHFNEPR